MLLTRGSSFDGENCCLELCRGEVLAVEIHLEDLKRLILRTFQDSCICRGCEDIYLKNYFEMHINPVGTQLPPTLCIEETH